MIWDIWDPFKKTLASCKVVLTVACTCDYRSDGYVRKLRPHTKQEQSSRTAQPLTMLISCRFIKTNSRYYAVVLPMRCEWLELNELALWDPVALTPFRPPIPWDQTNSQTWAGEGFTISIKDITACFITVLMLAENFKCVFVFGSFGSSPVVFLVIANLHHLRYVL